MHVQHENILQLLQVAWLWLSVRWWLLSCCRYKFVFGLLRHRLIFAHPLVRLQSKHMRFLCVCLNVCQHLLAFCKRWAIQTKMFKFNGQSKSRRIEPFHVVPFVFTFAVQFCALIIVLGALKICPTLTSFLNVHTLLAFNISICFGRMFAKRSYQWYRINASVSIIS